MRQTKSPSAAAIALLATCLSLPCVQAASAILYQPEQDSATIPGQPYLRFFTGDAHERKIVFYLSEEPLEAEPLPLVVYVQGSGSESLFVPDGDAVRANMGHDVVAGAFRGRARLVIVEKPGVEYLATAASDAFEREHTPERWTEAVHAVLEAARKLPEVAPGKILVVGHEEGGPVASRLVAEYDWVTHGRELETVDRESLDRVADWFLE
jgi:hypothetical protein